MIINSLCTGLFLLMAQIIIYPFIRIMSKVADNNNLKTGNQQKA